MKHRRWGSWGPADGKKRPTAYSKRLKRATQNPRQLSYVDLRGTDLRNAQLSNANLTGTDLREADLTGARLDGALLMESYLQHANLTDADLTGAMLDDADLSNANLTGANLTGARLISTGLQCTLLGGICWSGAEVARVQFAGARGLEDDVVLAIYQNGRNPEITDADLSDETRVLLALCEAPKREAS